MAKKKKTARKAPRKYAVPKTNRTETEPRRKKKRRKKKRVPVRPQPEITIHAGPQEDDGRRLVIAGIGDNRCELEFDTNSESARDDFIAQIAELVGCDAADLQHLHEQIMESASRADDLLESAGGNGLRIGQAALLVPDDNDVKYFHTSDGEAYIRFSTDAHRENWPVRSKTVRDWLTRQFFDETGRVPGNQALQDAATLMEAKAYFDGPERRVFLRIGEHENAIYLDLADNLWRAVRITPDGWSVVGNPNVRFRRSKSMLALPVPVRGGSVEQLRPFINTAGDDDWILSVAWLVGTFCPRGPYCVDAVSGEQGTAKSTRIRVLRSLVDPQIAAIRSEPKTVQDLMIAARGSWLLAFDNLTFVKDSLSDALCRLSTGGGFGTRRLYTDTDEIVIDLARPIAINGIEEVASRGDLLDRAIVHHLPRIPDSQRCSETDFWHRFEAVRPQILGALLDAVSAALRNREGIHLADPPRMADFATWVVAAESALPWEPREFIAAYDRNREEAKLAALENSPIYGPLNHFMEGRRREGHRCWTGTATALLGYLEQRAVGATTEKSGWPRNPQSLANKLRRLAPNLREIGMTIDFRRASGRDRTRTVRISVPEEFRVPADPSNPGPGEIPCLA